jgi:hypothetical protein
VPLTPEYQKILEASIADQAAGGLGNCVINARNVMRPILTLPGRPGAAPGRGVLAAPLRSRSRAPHKEPAHGVAMHGMDGKFAGQD